MFYAGHVSILQLEEGRRRGMFQTSLQKTAKPSRNRIAVASRGTAVIGQFRGRGQSRGSWQWGGRGAERGSGCYGFFYSIDVFPVRSLRVWVVVVTRQVWCRRGCLLAVVPRKAGASGWSAFGGYAVGCLIMASKYRTVQVHPESSRCAQENRIGDLAVHLIHIKRHQDIRRCIHQTHT